MKKLVFLLGLSTIVFSGCQEKRKIYKASPDVNKWIYEKVVSDYLWSAEIPGFGATDTENSPDEYFNTFLRYRTTAGSDYQSDIKGDRFTNVSRKSSSTRSSEIHAADETKNDYGFLYAPVVNTGGEVLYGLVMSVVKNSPAEKAGLKRGEVFNLVNDAAFPMGNSEFHQRMAAGSLKLNVIYPQSRTVKMNKATYDNNPVIFDTIYSTDMPSVTGYLVYNHFTAGTGGKFNNELREVFSRFKAAGVRTLILDLRYNGGGELSTARHLASLMAPSQLLDQPFIYLERNHSFGMESNFEATSLMSAAEIGAYNLDLESVYFLVSYNTASASELIMKGFEAFPNDIFVFSSGNVTRGKNVGGINISNASYEWEIDLITIRIYDRNKKSGYEAGIVPHLFVREEYGVPWGQNGFSGLTVVGPFGKPQQDPLLASVYEQIAGYIPRSAATHSAEAEGGLSIRIPEQGLIDDLR